MVLLKIEKLNKSIGIKDLFEDLSFAVKEKEKIALIGRNGLGKTTLFKIISGEDEEYTGIVETQKNLKIVLTKQEHFLDESITPLDYILEEVPNFKELLKTIRNYESTPSNTSIDIQNYTDAVNEFSLKSYYTIEYEILDSLSSFQIDEEKSLEPMVNLSGGEKRFVELVRVMYSGADLALIDEPTNHMDYVGKARFIEWLTELNKSVIVITHDRDVLKTVHRILELKNKKIISFNGNYDNFIEQNNIGTQTGISEYEVGLKKLDKVKKQMLEARDTKINTKSDKGRARAKAREDRFKKDYTSISADLRKPSFWIDKESLDKVNTEIIEKYNNYKEKNIVITNSNINEHKKLLLKIKHLSLGYIKPLFKDLNLEIYHGDRIFIKGRNGAGKSTLIKTLLEENLKQDKYNTQQLSHIEYKDSCKIFSGEFYFPPNLRIGLYEQEINKEYLNLTLEDAIFQLYYDLDIPVNQQKVNQVLGQYLFNPMTDAKLKFLNLSGGQKARFQLIKMLISNPNLLILDEPTNHLDLPSIEELEETLKQFNGGIIYISHDQYLINKLEGKVIELS